MMDSLFTVEEHISGKIITFKLKLNLRPVIYGIMDEAIRKTTGSLEEIYANQLR